MRTPDGSLQPLIDSKHSEVYWLVEIFLQVAPLRFTTGETVTLDSKTYLGGVPGYIYSQRPIQELATGAQEAVLELRNGDNLVGHAILANGARDRPVTISQYYPGADPTPMFTGFCGGTEIDDIVSIPIRTDCTAVATTPRLHVGPPLNNHVLGAGTRISFNGEIFTFE